METLRPSRPSLSFWNICGMENVRSFSWTNLYILLGCKSEANQLNNLRRSRSGRSGIREQTEFVVVLNYIWKKPRTSFELIPVSFFFFFLISKYSFFFIFNIRWRRRRKATFEVRSEVRPTFGEDAKIDKTAVSLIKTWLYPMDIY